MMLKIEIDFPELDIDTKNREILTGSTYSVIMLNASFFFLIPEDWLHQKETNAFVSC